MTMGDQQIVWINIFRFGFCAGVVCEEGIDDDFLVFYQQTERSMTIISKLITHVCLLR
jgi:hypothetical protein